MNKNKNIKPSPFHKKKGRKSKGDAIDKWGIKGRESDISGAFGEFQGIKTEKNLFAGAQNLVNIGDNFGGVKTDFDNQFAGMKSSFGGLQNQFANVSNQYEGMENTMEDLTVNQQQAQFEKEAGQQAQANAMDTFRGAAGGSGVAGLAQAMANQGQQSAQRASASIGQQESANQRMSAQNAGRIQEMKAKGATDAEIQRATGAQALDLAKAGGQERTQMAIAGGAASADQLSSQAELQRATGMQAGQIARGQGAMEAQKYRLQGLADARDLQLQQKQGELSFLSGQQEAGFANRESDTSKSDRRLKKNINKTGQSPSGLNIYSFEYKNPTDGKGLFQGVMSDEIPQEAVTRLDGYDMVNYGMLDVEFKQL